jgi:hypothetical protein
MEKGHTLLSMGIRRDCSYICQLAAMDKGHSRTWPWSLAQLEDDLSFTGGSSVMGKMVMRQDKRQQGNNSNELMGQAECGAQQGSEAAIGQIKDELSLGSGVLLWRGSHNII